MKDFLKKYGISEDQFLGNEQKGIKQKKYSPKDMAEITKGAYGNSDFCNYFMIC